MFMLPSWLGVCVRAFVCVDAGVRYSCLLDQIRLLTEPPNIPDCIVKQHFHSYVDDITLTSFVLFTNTGSYLLYNVHIARQNNQLQDATSKVTPKVTCNDVIFKFTAATIGVEWTYIFVSFLARGFVTVLFHLVVVLLKTVFKMLFSMMRHDKKEKTS